MLKEAEKSTPPRGNLDGRSLRKQGVEEKEKSNYFQQNVCFSYFYFMFYHFIIVKKCLELVI